MQSQYLHFGQVTCHFTKLEKKTAYTFLALYVYEHLFYILYSAKFLFINLKSKEGAYDFFQKFGKVTADLN